MAVNLYLFRQPKPFWSLAFGELAVTFSYYGTQTILILYFIRTFHLTHTDSYMLYGAYAALAYSLPILGGLIADRWLGWGNTVIIGGTLNVLGNILLMLSHHYLFCLGLALSLVGVSFCKGNLSQLVGTLYPDSSTQKEAGFTLMYLFINVGGVLGPLVYGLVIYALGWNWGFLCSAAVLFLATGWFIITHQSNNKIPITIAAVTFLHIVIIAMCLLISFMFYLPHITTTLIIAIFVVSISYLLTIILQYKATERRHLLALLVMSFFGMFFFAASLQVGSTITLFIQSAIQAGLLTIQFPASVFSTLYPLFVLVLAPFIGYLWQRLKAKNIVINMPVKLIVAMLLVGLGISVFALTAVTHLLMPGIVLGNLLLSAGEIILVPAVYMAISDYTPAGVKSTMMGGWLLFIAFGGYLSGVLANLSHSIVDLAFFQKNEYFAQFTFIAVFTFIIALILIMLRSRLVKMMR